MCLIFQRYKFKSKSQLRFNLSFKILRCVWYSKGTNLKANHNMMRQTRSTDKMCLIFQRYKFKSKSQLKSSKSAKMSWCVWYSKGTNLKANHNYLCQVRFNSKMCLIFQRYKFKSKSQLARVNLAILPDVFDIPKVQI